MKLFQRMISVAAALLTLISGMSVATLPTEAAQTSNSAISDEDIEFLHSQGITDDEIARILQNTSSRSGTQLNHYACFITSNTSTNTPVTFDVFRPQNYVSYYRYYSAASFHMNLVTHNSYSDPEVNYDYCDHYSGTINAIGYLGALRYTSSDSYLWTFNNTNYSVDCSLSITNEASIRNPILMGDVNQDNSLTITDLVWMYRIQANNEPASLTDDGRYASDITCDGSWAQNDDLTKLRKYLAGTIDCFW